MCSAIGDGLCTLHRGSKGRKGEGVKGCGLLCAEINFGRTLEIKIQNSGGASKTATLSFSLSLLVLIKRISDADKNFVDYHSPRCGKLLILMALIEVMTAIETERVRGRV